MIINQRLNHYTYNYQIIESAGPSVTSELTTEEVWSSFEEKTAPCIQEFQVKMDDKQAPAAEAKIGSLLLEYAKVAPIYKVCTFKIFIALLLIRKTSF